jgi:hypothetical protein
MTATDVAGQTSADWDEAQCTSALALLEGLQAQVTELYPLEVDSEAKKKLD